MTIEALREHHQRRPFEPFTMFLADGRSVVVEHPENLAVRGAGRTVIVTSPRSEYAETIDLLLVTSIAVDGGRKGRSPRGRRAA